MSCHLVEKVRKWEYVNLVDLLKDQNFPDQLIVINGQILSVSDHSGVASTGPTRACALPSTFQALPSQASKSHVIL